MVKCSLLYKKPETADGFGAAELLGDMSIDRAARRFCADSRHSERMIEVLSRPLSDPENVVYRQDILTDLLENPSLASELGRLFSRYDRISADWVSLRAEHRASPGDGSVSASARLERIFASLRATAVFPRTILSFVGALASALDSFPPRSEGLLALRTCCRGLLDGGRLEKIGEIASRFSDGEAADYDYEFILSLSPDLAAEGARLTAVNRRENKKSGLFGLFAKNTSAPSDTDESNGIDYCSDALCAALADIDAALSSLIGDIYELFHGLSTELTFFEAALSYVAFVRAAGIEPVFPKILPAEEETLHLKTVRDLHLLCEGMNSSAVVGNDADIAKGTAGVLIRGDNNTGKTVFLRSVGTAQIFAQAGLPVLAESAEISIRGAVRSHFSAAEEEFTRAENGAAVDTAGRFEGEVRKVAQIIDSLKPHSLLLLNETFQTTAYAEGAEGMREILAFLPSVGCSFIFVTHLGAMFDPVADDPLKELSVSRLRTSEGYRLLPF